MIYLIVAFLTFLITIVVTPYFINYLIRKDILDSPNGEERHLHLEPVPRLGGVIIFPVIFIITFAFYQDVSSKIYFIAGALITLGLGVYDDLRGVKWHVKFAVQSIAAVLLILSFNNYSSINFAAYKIPPVLVYIILFVLIVGILNSFNLMDGLDGLVAGFSLIILSAIFLLSIGRHFPFIPYLSAATIGTMLGFLKFNGNPARIFLGDSGSLTLGYVAAASVIGVSGEVTTDAGNSINNLIRTIDIAFVIIVLAVPLADTLRVMFVRLNTNKHPFLADSSHLHHLLYSKKIRHKTVVMLIHLISICFVLLSMYYARFDKVTGLIIYFIFLAVFFSIHPIIEFIIRKEHLLAYGRMLKRIPDLLPRIYKKFLLPFISFCLGVLIILLIYKEITIPRKIYSYFLLFLLPSLIYSGIELRKKNYYAELLVLVNLLLFFIITGLNGFFYKLYPVPLITQINLNQILVITLSGMVMFFVLFKERIINLRQQFLTGTDLTLAVLNTFIFIAVQFLDLPDSYKISDTILRSFLVFLFYKILITVFPKTHFTLYYISFLIAVIAVLKSVF